MHCRARRGARAAQAVVMLCGRGGDGGFNPLTGSLRLYECRHPAAELLTRVRQKAHPRRGRGRRWLSHRQLACTRMHRWSIGGHATPGCPARRTRRLVLPFQAAAVSIRRRSSPRRLVSWGRFERCLRSACPHVKRKLSFVPGGGSTAAQQGTPLVRRHVVAIWRPWRLCCSQARRLMALTYGGTLR